MRFCHNKPNLMLLVVSRETIYRIKRWKQKKYKHK